MAELLDIAKQGDSVSGADLQESIDGLRALAKAIRDTKAGRSVEEIQEIGRQEEALLAAADELVGAQIGLMVGEAKVGAEHINAAVAFAKEVVEQIADFKKKLEKVGAVLDFFAAVATGSGKQIVNAAGKLKKKLEE
jgi:hypothetical protein